MFISGYANTENVFYCLIKLPIVLKTDFERRDNALEHGIRLFTEIEAPVDDFGF